MVKKTTFLLIAFVAGASCKKKYTCVCVNNASQTSSTYTYSAYNIGAASSNCIQDHGVSGAACNIK